MINLKMDLRKNAAGARLIFSGTGDKQMKKGDETPDFSRTLKNRVREAPLPQAGTDGPGQQTEFKAD